jgi:hypothetical protein
VAAIVAPLVGELGALLGGSGLGATIARGALAGVGAVAAGDLLKAIQNDLSSGNPTAVANARRVPQYAIVDMHTNKVVRTLSSKHVYSILTHPRRRRGMSRRPQIITAPAGSEIITVR